MKPLLTPWKVVALTLLGLVSPASANEASTPEAQVAPPAGGTSTEPKAPAAQIDELKAQVESLKQHLEQLEAHQQTAVAPTPPAPAPASPMPTSQKFLTEGESPVSFKLPTVNTTVRFGGFAKLDFIYDIDAPQGYLVFVPGTPLRGSADANRRGQILLHARESRFAMETLTTIPYGEIKTYLEGDFFLTEGNELVSNSYRLRLRHMFGTVGPILAGQTWSTFMDVPSLPENEDHEGPSGQNLVRQGQVRYTFDLNTGGALALAVENPQSEFVEKEGTTASPLDRWPDFIARWSISRGWGHLTLRAVARELRSNDGAGHVDAQFGYGVGIAGSFKTFGKDLVLYEASGGDGIGRYILDVAGQGASFDGEHVHVQPAWGGFLAYQHWWTDTIRSTAVYSLTRIYNDTDVVPGSTNSSTQSFHVNVFWNLTRQVELGLEYIYGRRKTVDNSIGDFNRLQSGLRFTL